MSGIAGGAAMARLTAEVMGLGRGRGRQHVELAGLGPHVAQALEEYAALAEYFPGAEAGVRYAKLLKSSGNAGQARQILESLLERAKYAPDHYKKAQREWLDEAHSELRSS